METIIVRNALEKDIPSMADIQIHGWKATYKGIMDDAVLESMNREDQIAKFKRNYKKNADIVAVSQDEVVGYCRYVGNNTYSQDIQEADCELLALYVEPKRKRKGIGSALFQFAVSDLKGKGKKNMILWCLKENAPSRMFYERMGGCVVAEKEEVLGRKTNREVGYLYSLSSVEAE